MIAFDKMTFGDWIAIQIEVINYPNDYLDRIKVMGKIVSIFNRDTKEMDYDNWDEIYNKTMREMSIVEISCVYDDLLKWIDNFIEHYKSYFGEHSEDKGGPDLGPVFDFKRWQYHLQVSSIIGEIPSYTPEDVYGLNIHDAYMWLTMIKERQIYQHKMEMRSLRAQRK